MLDNTTKTIPSEIRSQDLATRAKHEQYLKGIISEKFSPADLPHTTVSFKDIMFGKTDVAF